MSSRVRYRDSELRSQIFESLANCRRRTVVSILLNRDSSLTERELAGLLVETDPGEPDTESISERIRTIHTDLCHVHLPRLESAGLVNWDRVEATVTATDHPAFRDPQFERILEAELPDGDDVVACLADERRRRILSVLAVREEPLTREALARAVIAREQTQKSRGDEDDVRLSLAHVHLPKLADAGIVMYDPDDGTVAYEGHPVLVA